MGWSVLPREIRFLFTRSGEMTRAREVAQRRLARVLRGRKEPHGKNLTDETYRVSANSVGGLWNFTQYGAPSLIGFEFGVRFE